MKTMRQVFACIAGSVLLVIGFALATGIEVNPIQAVYSIACLSASCVLLRSLDREERAETRLNATKPNGNTQVA